MKGHAKQREVVAASYGRTELANRKRLALPTVLPYPIDHIAAFARAMHVLLWSRASQALPPNFL
jgi:hypothetical protein